MARKKTWFIAKIGTLEPLNSFIVTKEKIYSLSLILRWILNLTLFWIAFENVAFLRELLFSEAKAFLWWFTTECFGREAVSLTRASICSLRWVAPNEILPPKIQLCAFLTWWGAHETKIWRYDIYLDILEDNTSSLWIRVRHWG